MCNLSRSTPRWEQEHLTLEGLYWWMMIFEAPLKWFQMPSIKGVIDLLWWRHEVAAPRTLCGMNFLYTSLTLSSLPWFWFLSHGVVHCPLQHWTVSSGLIYNCSTNLFYCTTSCSQAGHALGTNNDGCVDWPLPATQSAEKLLMQEEHFELATRRVHAVVLSVVI